MSQKIDISREEAEWLVDELENKNPFDCGTWAIDLSSRIRETFGMGQMTNYTVIRSEVEAYLDRHHSHPTL
jgi:hypothetical protein